MNLDDLVSKINKLSKLALEIGTLVAVIRFIIL